MKNQVITIRTEHFNDHVIEDILQKRDKEIKDLARKNARHFAKRNLPSAEGDNLLPYTGEIRTGYEKLAADVVHRLQPGAHFPEARIDADYFREKDRELENAIHDRESKNQNDEYELSDFNHSSIPSRMRWAFIATIIIVIGEIMFNTKAFQVTGENLLFALILSICISFAVFVFAHIAPLQYKKATTRAKRIVVIVSSLLLVTGLFIALAIFRSSYLAVHKVYINPTYFVVINLFFFIVSALLSYFVMPTWEEIRQNALKFKTHLAIKRRKKEIAQLSMERDKIKEVILERTKLRMRVAHHSNYTADRIRKMYWESLEVFKTTNLTYRTDSRTPDCFLSILDEPNITDFNFTIISPNTLE